MNMRSFLFMGLTLFLFHASIAQIIDSIPLERTKKLTFNGYIKDLNNFRFPVMNFPFRYGHLIHNRLNFKWQSSHINASVEIRNRLLWGYNPNAKYFGSIERAWLEYKAGKWSIKTGRQRINWGMNNAWNPNDIFNSFNMIDFDYEERVGVDGLRVHYQRSDMSAIEFVVSKSMHWRINNYALKYHLNRSNYDWQLIGGVFQGILTAGLGWQGSIGETGFKGEVQHFFKKENQNPHTNFSIEFDYITKKGWYFNATTLFNQKGFLKSPLNLTSLKFENTPDNLMPTKWNILVGASKDITPVINGKFNYIFSPVNNMMVFLPSISFNVLSNLDLDIIWQTFLIEQLDAIRPINHNAFIRGKISF